MVHKAGEGEEDDLFACLDENKSTDTIVRMETMRSSSYMYLIFLIL